MNFINILRGTSAVIALILSTILCSIPVFVMGLLKLYPNQVLRIFCTNTVDAIASFWIDINNYYLDTFNSARCEISGMIQLNPRSSHLVIANHQSWLDIVILQRVLNHKIPILKFFIKDELKWVPFLGFAWWAMGCPFMKRYSQSYLAKNPHKKGKDLRSTKKALQLLKARPTTLMSFIEGTRYTLTKKIQQDSPYTHLLKPKAGGIGFAIEAMYTQITQLLDVTIVYPTSNYSLWNFLCCRINVIKVHVRQLPIPPEFLNSNIFANDKVLLEFRRWLNSQWADKDQIIESMQTMRS